MTATNVSKGRPIKKCTTDEAASICDLSNRKFIEAANTNGLTRHGTTGQIWGVTEVRELAKKLKKQAKATTTTPN